MSTKLYPFSVQKHAHDVEFRRNRVQNQIHDLVVGESTESYKGELDELEALETGLTDLLLAVLDSRDGRVAYLTGKQIGLAKETVLWAGESRASTMIASGRPAYA